MASKSSGANPAGIALKSLMSAINTISDAIGELKSVNANGVFNDKETKRQQAIMKKITDQKVSLTNQLTGAPSTGGVSPGRRKSTAVAVPDENLSDVEDFFEQLIQDSDSKAGNLNLMKAFLAHVPLDYSALSESRGLMCTCAVDGSMGYLEAFLVFLSERNSSKRRPSQEVESTSDSPRGFDTEELMASAMFNQQFRIPLVSMLLKYQPLLRLEAVKESIQSNWQEFVADIASKKKAIPREDRNGRQQLIEKMLRHPVVVVDPAAEGGDGLTMFSRAAAEGDQPLIDFMIKEKLFPAINKPNGDGMTALMHAVVGNIVSVVKALLNIAGIDLHVEGPHGSALTMASLLKRDPAIVSLLKEKAASCSSSTTVVGLSHSPPDPTSPSLGLQSRSDSFGKSSNSNATAPVAAPAKRATQLPSLAGRIPVPTVLKDDEDINPLTGQKRTNNGKLEKLKETPRKLGTALEPAKATTSPQRSPQAPLPLEHGAVKNPRTTLATAPVASGSKSTPANSLSPQSRGLQPLVIEETKSDTTADNIRRSVDSGLSSKKPSAVRPQKQMPNAKNLLSSQSSLSKSTESEGLYSEISLYSQESAMTGVFNDSSAALSHEGSDFRKSHSRSHFDIVELVRRAASVKTKNTRRASMGMFTDDEYGQQESGVAEIAEMKYQIANGLRKYYPIEKKRKYCPSSDDEEEFSAFFASCVLESDIDPANTGLVLRFLESVDLNYATIIAENQLISSVIEDGSVSFVEALLAVPLISYDLQEVVCCAMFNQQNRIPLVRCLFRRLTKSQLQQIRDDMWDEYNEFYADICSLKKAIPCEDRTQRISLLETMLTHPILKLDPKREGGDGMTVFSRAAHEGDAELIHLMIRHKAFHHPNLVLADGATALVHAVYGANYEVLKLMLSIPDVDVNFNAPQSGSAYAVAKNLKRDQRILTLLKDQGGNDALGRSSIFEVPVLSPLLCSRLEESVRGLGKSNSMTLTPQAQSVPGRSPMARGQVTKKKKVPMATVPDIFDDL